MIREGARSFADCLDGRAWELKPPSIRIEWSTEDVVWSRYCTKYSSVSTPGWPAAGGFVSKAWSLV